MTDATERQRRAYELLQAGRTYAQVASALGISRGRVSQLVNAYERHQRQQQVATVSMYSTSTLTANPTPVWLTWGDKLHAVAISPGIQAVALH